MSQPSVRSRTSPWINRFCSAAGVLVAVREGRWTDAGANPAVELASLDGMPLLEEAAEAAYHEQLDSPVKLPPEMAKLLGRPRWPCFWGEEVSSDLIVGKQDAGYGYRTCGLRQLRHTDSGSAGSANSSTTASCIVYSFGCDADFEFERTVAAIHGSHCEIHIFDVFDPGEGFDRAFDGFDVSVHFHQMPVFDKDEGKVIQPWPHAEPYRIRTYTLPNIMNILGHEHVDILKLDIEGNEHRVIAHLAEAGWPSLPGQLYLELHAGPQFYPYEVPHAQRLIDSLEHAGLRLFNVERPWRWCQDSCLQLSFIHKSWRPAVGGYPAGGGWLKEAYDCDMDGLHLLYEVLVNGTGNAKGLFPQAIKVTRPYQRVPSMLPGSWFTVRWQIRNTGTVSWLKGCCTFVLVAGDDWSAAPAPDDDSSLDLVNVISAEVQPGDYSAGALEFYAPWHPGPHSCQWRLRTLGGHFFGPSVEIAVEVLR
eukprot:gnl/TRDRNA2_/TRDRNA2_202740_c0_seq1.p1 gnl/TRDRNA2_/TRDRNA2_202740_c0~~gnl/TRDRNA2_/TRDRNA2_202740_c0_seq1.p1  ORF type:complete len:477 (-),score=58.45 gnl/TRDRNA2_/TRDRNA2_202740_c0_seq1:79-1509(-)